MIVAWLIFTTHQRLFNGIMMHKQFIRDCIQEIDFSVQVVDFRNPFYYVYILIEQNPQKTLNQLLVQNAYAIEVNDSQDPTVYVDNE